MIKIRKKLPLTSMQSHVTNFFSLLNSFFFHFISGSRSGSIHHHDVRVANHHIGTLNGHTQEVCGLQWSPDGRHLASGGNDNVLNIWPAHIGSLVSETSPIYTFTQHQAAVKVRLFSCVIFKSKIKDAYC